MSDADGATPQLDCTLSDSSPIVAQKKITSSRNSNIKETGERAESREIIKLTCAYGILMFQHMHIDMTICILKTNILDTPSSPFLRAA